MAVALWYHVNSTAWRSKWAKKCMFEQLTKPKGMSYLFMIVCVGLCAHVCTQMFNKLLKNEQWSFCVTGVDLTDSGSLQRAVSSQRCTGKQKWWSTLSVFTVKPSLVSNKCHPSRQSAQPGTRYRPPVEGKGRKQRSNALVEIKARCIRKKTAMRDGCLFAQQLVFSLQPHLAPMDTKQTN